MNELKRLLITGPVIFMLLMIAAVGVFPKNVAGQAPSWFQEQMRRQYERNQWLQWQRQEQMRQIYDRQQWLQFQQQEMWRRLYNR